MMFHDSGGPLSDEDDPWDEFELWTTDHRRIEVSYNHKTGAYFTVERPTACGPPARDRP